MILRTRPYLQWLFSQASISIPCSLVACWSSNETQNHDTRPKLTHTAMRQYWGFLAPWNPLGYLPRAHSWAHWAAPQKVSAQTYLWSIWSICLHANAAPVHQLLFSMLLRIDSDILYRHQTHPSVPNGQRLIQKPLISHHTNPKGPRAESKPLITNFWQLLLKSKKSPSVSAFPFSCFRKNSTSVFPLYILLPLYILPAYSV